MNTDRPSPPPQRVPTLTEVIDLPGEARVAEPSDASDAGGELPVASEPLLAALPSEDELTRHVLADVQRQLDLMLDYRLRETLTPLLARLTDGLVRDARAELASTLRDVVARAVAQELSRHRGR
jgi:hypothetical protein